MLKVLHFADVHVGMENYGKTEPGTGLSSRVADFVHRMDDIVKYAREHEADLAIFAGDAFKNRNPNPTFQREFAHRILDLADLCPVVMLVGNHDIPTNMKRASSIEVFETMRVQNVHVGMDYELLQVQTKAGPVQVATAPYPVRAQLLEQVPHGVSISQLDDLLQARLHHILDDLARQAEQSEAPRILVGHFTIAGALTGSERQIMLGRDVAALLSSVADSAWDYVAMGHIHKYQDLTRQQAGQPPVVYSGSIERIDFGEEGDTKGFVWAEIERGRASYEFIPLFQARPFLTLRVDVRNHPNPTQKVLHHIEDYEVEDAVVRVIITADPPSDALLKPKMIEDFLYERGANVVAAVQRVVERPERARLGLNPEGLSSLQLLEKYFQSRQFPEGEIRLLLETAAPLFQAVDERIL
jgi:exonuclease SbcD